MSRRRPPNGRGSRIPTWVLVALVVAALGGATFLFVADFGGRSPSEPAAPAPEAPRKKPKTKGVLTMPKEKDAIPPRRRSEAQDASEDAASDSAEDKPLPSTFVHLRGTSIALAPASAGAADTSKGKVKIGGLTLSCTSGSDPERLRRELVFLSALRKVLERAAADVTVLVDERGRVDCIDRRARSLAAADLAIVARSGATPTGRVLAARATGSTDSGARPQSAELAAEVAAALELTGSVDGTSRSDRSLLASAAALDLGPDGATALVELPAADSDEVLAELAFNVARGLAATASSAASKSKR